LSDQETRERMLRAAMDMINRTGLTVSLDHIRFEDVIRDADVARSTAYRHWPYRDLFFSDLVKELARSAGPAIIADEISLIKQVMSEHPDWLETPQLRHCLILELIRRLALLDFQSILASPQWRTYLALHATFSGLSDGELRDQIQAALAHAEADHVALVAQAWHQIAGLVITALSTPEVAAHSTVASPFGAAGKDPWSLPANAMASIAMAFLETDPTSEWDDRRLAEIHRALDTWAAPDP
jgi:AcrR family transcriptional regulator